MKPERVRQRLKDILTAIDRIERFVAGVDLEAYLADGDKQWLVERGVEIVSEASRHIPQSMIETYPNIEWRSIRGIGNRLRHEYDRVDPALMWTVATQGLADLKPVVAAMLASLDTNSTT